VMSGSHDGFFVHDGLLNRSACSARPRLRSRGETGGLHYARGPRRLQRHRSRAPRTARSRLSWRRGYSHATPAAFARQIMPRLTIGRAANGREYCGMPQNANPRMSRCGTSSSAGAESTHARRGSPVAGADAGNTCEPSRSPGRGRGLKPYFLSSVHLNSRLILIADPVVRAYN
jgi:hypothetical protein